MKLHQNVWRVAIIIALIASPAIISAQETGTDASDTQAIETDSPQTSEAEVETPGEDDQQDEGSENDGDADDGEIVVETVQNDKTQDDEIGDEETVEQAPEEEAPAVIVIEYPDEQGDIIDSVESDPDDVDVASSIKLPQIDVIGSEPDALDSVPGAATLVTQEDLTNQAPISANEVLRNVPGVHVNDEEGIGLRPNYGIRGLNPSRSRNVLVLEDGVPISLAPYGEPELYFAPPIENMQGLEVVKGSGSILYGPQTIGGVINYLSAAPPEEFKATAEARAGSYGYYMGRVTVGDTHGDVGYHLSLTHLRFDGHRNLNLEMTDFVARFRLQLGEKSSLGLKFNVYDEVSNATYLGLTTPQFETDPSFNFAENDVLPVRRYAVSATHNVLLGSSALLQTTVYGHNIIRNWTRQDFDRTDGGRDYERIIDGQGRNILGDSTRPDDGSTIYFRDSTGSRNREFHVGGIEPRLTVDYALGSVDNELTVGARFHAEQALEQRLDGQNHATTSGDLREDEIRTGLALSAYALNRFTFFDRLKVSPGVRVESLWSDREVLRKRVDGVPTDLNPTVSDELHVLALIPGLGISYALLDELTVFAGAHRGFAPPRTKDAITNDGENLQLDAEYSINYELGLRSHIEDYFFGEVTGFMLDFSNQIIAPTEAGGAVSQSELALVNSGQTQHLGVETSATFDTATFAGWGFQLPLTLTYTYVHSEFGNGWNEDIAGNKLPYSPMHRASGQLRFVHTSGLSAQINGHYLSSQFTDKANTEDASVNGLTGEIDPRLILDARLAYTYQPWGITAFVSGKNLTDERYIASRAPTGIQPGMFRQFIGGIQGEF